MTYNQTPSAEMAGDNVRALKSCPFCGGKPMAYVATDLHDKFAHWTTIKCEQCGCEQSEEYTSQAIAAWNQRAPVSGELQPGWRDIASAPPDEPILAAVEVRNNKTGAHWWERHVIVIDSETGNVTHDTDAGWSAGDYTHWMPLPATPDAEGTKP